MQDLKKIVLRIENEHGNKLEALFDGYQQTCERLDVIEQKLDDLSDKVEEHDIRIQVMERGQK